jgi:hypothetical protein
MVASDPQTSMNQSKLTSPGITKCCITDVKGEGVVGEGEDK